MSILCDKFNIIENPTQDLGKEDINPLIDNYLENLLFSDERIIHPDFFLSLSYFEKNKDIEYTQMFSKHLENYLKQKKLSMRNNIKNGNFELNTLIKLIETYSDKIKKVYQISNNIIIRKTASSLLYEQIILENSLSGFLKSELSTIEESKSKYIFSLINKMIEINKENPETKVYQWFLFLISSALSTTIEENFNKTFPVPQNYQSIINFTNNADFCMKIYNFYVTSPATKEMNIILCASIRILIEKLIDIFDTCNLTQINKIMKTNFDIINIIVNKLNLPYDNKSIKEIITSKFFFIIDQKITNIKDTNLNILKELTECFQIFEKFISNSGTTRDIIDSKISSIFSNQATQDYLIETVHQNIISKGNNLENETLANIIGFCSNIKEKDIFIDKYNKLLILRMLNNPDIEIEKLYLHILIGKFGQKLLFKTNKIITDMEYSIGDNQNFKELNICPSRTLNVITTSFNNWDINQQEGLISDDMVNIDKNYISFLYNHLNTYQYFYKKRYENKRKLIWYPHFGHIIFEYLGKDIKMLPIQFLILEFIFNKKTCSKEDLINADFFINYNDQFKKSLISSLLGGILTIKNDIITLSEDNDKQDYIEIFFNTTNYRNIWESKRREEFAMNRIDVINSLINHHVKKNRLSKEELFEKIKSNDTFEVPLELFNKSIDLMIEKDYVKINESGAVEKILY